MSSFPGEMKHFTDVFPSLSSARDIHSRTLSTISRAKSPFTLAGSASSSLNSCGLIRCVYVPDSAAFFLNSSTSSLLVIVSSAPWYEQLNLPSTSTIGVITLPVMSPPSIRTSAL